VVLVVEMAKKTNTHSGVVVVYIWCKIDTETHTQIVVLLSNYRVRERARWVLRAPAKQMSREIELEPRSMRDSIREIIMMNTYKQTNTY